MIEEYENKRRKDINRMRSIMDYVMGTLFVGIGIYFLLNNSLQLNAFNRAPSSVDYLLGGIFVLYGGWRIYRGYKKNYFR